MALKEGYTVHFVRAVASSREGAASASERRNSPAERAIPPPRTAVSATTPIPRPKRLCDRQTLTGRPTTSAGSQSSARSGANRSQTDTRISLIPNTNARDGTGLHR